MLIKLRFQVINCVCSICVYQVAFELYRNTTARRWLSRIVITINAPLVHLQVLLVNYSITCFESTLLVSVKLHLSCTIAIIHSNSPVAAHMSQQQPCYNVTKCMLIQLVLFVCRETKFVDHIAPQYLFNNYDVYPYSHMVWHNQLRSWKCILVQILLWYTCFRYNFARWHQSG